MAKTLTALSLTALVALALSATSALAAPSKDPVADRQAILKGFGPPTGEAVQMMQGKLPFDLAKVQAALDYMFTDEPEEEDDPADYLD